MHRIAPKLIFIQANFGCSAYCKRAVLSSKKKQGPFFLCLGGLDVKSNEKGFETF